MVGALDHADDLVVQVGQLQRAELLRYQERLAVVVVDCREADLGADGTFEIDGAVAHQHVELAGGQPRESVLRRGRDEIDLGRVAEHGGGDRAAEIDVEAFPFLGGILRREAGRLAVHAAQKLAALLDQIESALLLCLSLQRQQRHDADHQYPNEKSHVLPQEQRRPA